MGLIQVSTGRTSSWMRWFVVVVVLSNIVSYSSARGSLQRGRMKTDNRLQFERELPEVMEKQIYRGYHGKGKGGMKKKCKGMKGSKSGKGKGGKGKGGSKKSKKYCDELDEHDGTYGYDYGHPRPPSPAYAGTHPVAMPAYHDYDDHYAATEPQPSPNVATDEAPALTPAAPWYWFSPTDGTPAYWPTVEGAGEAPEPTSRPTGDPTVSPTESPTSSPTDDPTSSPTNSPTLVPTAGPTTEPTESPTGSPTSTPTEPDPTSAPVNPTAASVEPDPTQAPLEPTSTPIDPTSAPSPVVAETQPITTSPSPTVITEEAPAWSPVWTPSYFSPTNLGIEMRVIESDNEKGTISTCIDQPQRSDTNTQVLTYDYEMLVDFGVNNVEDIATHLEYRMQTALTRRLLKCGSDNVQNGGLDEELDDFDFLTIISLPKDDLELAECSGDLEIQGTECHVFTGRYTISFMQGQESLYDLLDGMSSIMKELMHATPSSRRELQDSELYGADDPLRALYFKGFRYNEADSIVRSGAVDEQVTSTRTVVGAVSLVAAALIVIFGGLIVFRRRREIRSYLDMSNDIDSRIGINGRNISSSISDSDALSEQSGNNTSGYDLSVYTSGQSTNAEDLTPRSRCDVDTVSLGISPREGSDKKPIVTPDLCKTQDLARDLSQPSLSQSSISIASEDISPFNDTVDV